MRLLLLGVAGMLALGVGSALAPGPAERPETPHAQATAEPSSIATAASVTCGVAPRSFEEIEALLRRAEATPPVTRTPGVMPSGSPADASTVAAARATVEELLACFATGEPLRVWGLYSNAYLARLLYRQRGFNRRLYDAYATPRPADADERVVLRSLDDVVRLDERRVGATVVLFYPGLGLEKRFFFEFVDVGDRWLIDDIVGEITFSVP